MIIGIDAFNIRAGGGVTHLIELLRAADPLAHGFKKVVVWGSSATLSRIDDRDWLYKVHEPFLDYALPYRLYWQRFRSRKLAQKAKCDLVFVPGGSDSNGFTPIVTMSRNMLPFEFQEIRRHGWSLTTLKLLLIRWAQIRSFRKAKGVIFLTKYAFRAITGVTGKLQGTVEIIPHGISPRFCLKPRPQRSPTAFDESHPCRILYVSFIYAYKHQWYVAEAVSQLRKEGIHVVLELIGSPSEGMRRLMKTLNRVDPQGKFITLHGEVPYEKLKDFYASADIGVFASSCENMPNILVENMAAGLPIACSNMGPMPEILGDAGIYFNPFDSDDIASSIRKLIDSSELRNHLAQSAFVRAHQYSWQRCADETFKFLSIIAQGKRL